MSGAGETSFFVFGGLCIEEYEGHGVSCDMEKLFFIAHALSTCTIDIFN